MGTESLDIASHGDEPARTGLALFFLGESLAFAALLVAYGTLRMRAPAWPAPGEPPLPVATLAGVTMLLVLAWGAFQRAAAEGRRTFHAIGCVLGVAFLAAQAWVNASLWSKGLTWSSGHYAQTYLAITGFHGVHVLAGLLLWPKGPSRQVGIARYWNFLLFTQLAVFTLLELL